MSNTNFYTTINENTVKIIFAIYDLIIMYLELKLRGSWLGYTGWRAEKKKRGAAKGRKKVQILLFKGKQKKKGTW